MNNLKETEQLAESGADELSIMEFVINNELYGINIAKVKEIISVMPVKPMQKSNPNVEGIFKLRDQVITVIDLGAYLGLPASEDPEKDIFIITSLNHQDFAFHVHRVVGIDQLTWAEMKKPDKTIYGGGKGIATGIADFENRLITILDFEKIIMELNPESNELYSNIEKLGTRERTEKHILVAEDSILLSKMIIDSLHKAGYVNTTKAENGLEAWDFLCEARDSGDDITDHVACIVSDIEMPQMDGYTLTKKVKTDSVLKEIPLVLFSSLITDEMKYKGKELGADAQISKPEIANLVSMIDKLIAPEEVSTVSENTNEVEN
ncbi:chemotaxis protein [Scatolibacter rhodanostii]|uniref:chemotaxis protein n=1 Tax=Scatolibacter rhodanostii TaxID=2014781 RepID=UPI000C06B850|nr:chemotaxis protein [Scatolibacter rhodanostii]